MKYCVNRVAVIGAGVMGLSIASHLIGSGIPVLLLDMVPRVLTEEEEAKGLTISDMVVRNRIVNNAKKMFLNPKFGYCYTKKMGDYLTVGNLEDHLDLLQTCDMVIEAVIENLEIKQSVFAKVAKNTRKGTILASNTSGLLLNDIAKGLEVEDRKCFVGLHFFNPVRHMKLLEIIPCKESDEQMMSFLKDFATNRIGKDVVIAKDYTNFIGSRLGIVTCAAALKIGENMGYSVPEIDALTGEIIGRPRAATCRLLDLVGIDIFVHVSGNIRKTTENIYEKEANTPPKFVFDMVEAGQLGDKVRGGFYQTKVVEGKKQKLHYDYTANDYKPSAAVKTPVTEALLGEKDLQKRLHMAVWGTEKENIFIWNVVKQQLLYTANNQEEMAHSTEEVDVAMRSGYNWIMGPYEIWDAIGLVESVERMTQEGENIPEWIVQMLADGKTSFYTKQNRETEFINIHDEAYEVVFQNKGGTLRHIGDGVLNLEFTTPACSINDDLNEAIAQSLSVLENNGQYVGLVLGHNQKNFCVGGQLNMIADRIRKNEFVELEHTCRKFQEIVMDLKYAKKPIVACIKGKALGGGAEIALHCTKRVLHVEAMMGLPEANIGLLPAGGGTKEMMLHSLVGVEKENTGTRANRLQAVIETLSAGAVATNAYQAMEMGFAKETDSIVMNELGLIDVAKAEILYMTKIGFRPKVKSLIKVTGTTGLGLLKYLKEYKFKSHKMTEYDKEIYQKISDILCGGEVVPDAVVTEDWLLELEIRGFIALCHNEKTLERIEGLYYGKKVVKN